MLKKHSHRRPSSFTPLPTVSDMVRPGDDGDRHRRHFRQRVAGGAALARLVAAEASRVRMVRSEVVEPSAWIRKPVVAPSVQWRMG